MNSHSPQMHLRQLAVRIFPITLLAYERGGAREFRQLFLDNRPKDQSWYAYDTEILSPTHVKFTVYGMLDMVYGGIGEKRFEFEVTDVAPDITRAAIDQRIRRLACCVRETEIAKAEEAKIDGYASEIRNLMNVT